MPTSACDICRTPLAAEQLVTISGKTVCAKCKPDVVMNLKSGVSASRRIAPARSEEIKRRISRLNIMSFMFALPGLALQFAPLALVSGGASRETLALVTVLRLLGFPLVIAGLVCYSLMKGRSGLLGLFGLLSCIGLLVLHFFPKKCQHCASGASYNAKECGSCGAPV